MQFQELGSEWPWPEHLNARVHGHWKPYAHHSSCWGLPSRAEIFNHFWEHVAQDSVTDGAMVHSRGVGDPTCQLLSDLQVRAITLIY